MRYLYLFFDSGIYFSFFHENIHAFCISEIVIYLSLKGLKQAYQINKLKYRTKKKTRKESNFISILVHIIHPEQRIDMEHI